MFQQCIKLTPKHPLKPPFHGDNWALTLFWDDKAGFQNNQDANAGRAFGQFSASLCPADDHLIISAAANAGLTTCQVHTHAHNNGVQRLNMPEN